MTRAIVSKPLHLHIHGFGVHIMKPFIVFSPFFFPDGGTSNGNNSQTDNDQPEGGKNEEGDNEDGK